LASNQPSEAALAQQRRLSVTRRALPLDLGHLVSEIMKLGPKRPHKST
jgi:hypothetical protein